MMHAWFIPGILRRKTFQGNTMTGLFLKEDEMSDSVEKNPKQISKKIKDFYSNLFTPS